MITTDSPEIAHDTGSPRAARVLDVLLVAAVLAAIALALGGVMQDPAARPRGAVAVVNGHAIPRAELDAVLGRLAGQLGHQPGAAERAEVLARLLDEELLIQRGLALDLPRSDARLRGLLVQEVMRQALSGVSQQPVDAQQLAEFHAANLSYFRRPARLRAARYDFADADAARTFRLALDAPARRAESLAAHTAARNTLLPDTEMTEAKLGDYLGADLAGRLAALAPGASLLQELPDGRASVLVLLDAAAAEPASFESIRAQVEVEYRRRRDEQAISDYLRRLRDDSRIVVDG